MAKKIKYNSSTVELTPDPQAYACMEGNLIVQYPGAWNNWLIEAEMLLTVLQLNEERSYSQRRLSDLISLFNFSLGYYLPMGLPQPEIYLGFQKMHSDDC